MKLFRHNLSGGVIGEDLPYRADLEHYHKANLVQNSFLPTPYGGMMRRPGSQKLTTHEAVAVEGVVYSPQMVRYFDFVYDRIDQYVVALISYAAAGKDTWSRLEIFDTAGTLKDTVDCDYAALNFHEIAVKQLNDVMYLAHNGYPTAILARDGDTNWSMDAAEISGGPWLPWNADTTTLSVEKEVFDLAATYAAFDTLHAGGEDFSITATAYISWYSVWVIRFWYGYTRNVEKKFYLLRLTIATAHGILVGDAVSLTGFTGDSDVLNGTYSAKRVGDNYIEVDTGRIWVPVEGGSSYMVWVNDYPLPESFSTETLGVNGGNQFFVSLEDENIGHALPVAPETETAWWRRTGHPGLLTLKSSVDLFQLENVGQKVYCSVNIAQTYDGKFTSTGQASEPYPYSNGSVTLRTQGGVWDGLCALQQSTDGGVTWEELAVINGSGGNHNGEKTVDVLEPLALYRVCMKVWSVLNGSTSCMWQMEFPAGAPFVGNILEYTDAQTVTVLPETALTKLFQTANWRLGAFSEANGYPGVVAIHDERLMLGGSILQPFMVWGSEINNWTNFADGTLETSSLALQANADRATRLCWMASKGELLFGTDFNEYSAGSRDSDTVMSAANPPKIQVQNSYSSAPIQALLIGEDVIFVQSDYKTLRSMAFSDAKWGYAGQNMTIFSPDIAGSGFRWLAVQKSPFPVIWAGTEDDALISFTVDKENNIMGWAKHPLAGAVVVSGCVIPTLGDDTLFICTNRTGVFQMEKLSYANPVFTDDQGGSETVMTSLMQPTNLAQSAESLEEIKVRYTKVYLYVKESQGGEVSADGGKTWASIPYDTAELFSGKLEVSVNSGNTERACPMIRTTGSQPFNLLSIGIEIDRQTTKE